MPTVASGRSLRGPWHEWSIRKCFPAHRLMHLRASPHEVALGCAVGVFVAITPLLGAHMLQPTETILKPAYEVLVAQLGEHHTDTAEARRLFRDLYTSWGRANEARLYQDPPAPVAARKPPLEGPEDPPTKR